MGSRASNSAAKRHASSKYSACVHCSPPNLIATLLVYYLPTLLLFPLAHWLIERYEDADVRFR